MKKLAAVFMVATLSACATPYGKYGLLGGFTDSRIDENTFSSSVDTNGLTSHQTTSMHAFYRAAELTIENGFDYFVIASEATNSTSMAMANARRQHKQYNYQYLLAPPHTEGQLPPTHQQLLYLWCIQIQRSSSNLSRGPNAYDARSVMKYIGPQIGVEQGKKP